MRARHGRHPAVISAIAYLLDADEDFEGTLREVHRLRHDDPSRSADIAWRGVELAERLQLPTPAVCDCRARAWGAYGNALRILGECRGAHAALDTAAEHASRGSGDPGIRAKLHEWSASLDMAERHPAAAALALGKAIELRMEDGDPAATARCLVKLAMIQSGESEEAAIVTLTRAASLIDGREHPALAWEIAHNACCCCLEGGEVAVALEMFQEQQEALRVLCKSPGYARRLRWLGARLALAMGQLEIAIHDLRDVRDAFAAASLPLETAQCGLELSYALAQHGDLVEAHAVLQDAGGLFAMLALTQETEAARLLRAAIEGAALAEILPELIAAVRRDARWTPRRQRPAA